MTVETRVNGEHRSISITDTRGNRVCIYFGDNNDRKKRSIDSQLKALFYVSNVKYTAHSLSEAVYSI